MMTREELLNTEWGKYVAEHCYFDIFYEYISADGFNCTIIKSHDTGGTLYAIAPSQDLEFWLEAKPTKQEALDFCKEMGWPVCCVIGED